MNGIASGKVFIDTPSEIFSGDPSKGHGGHSRSPTVFLPIT